MIRFCFLISLFLFGSCSRNLEDNTHLNLENDHWVIEFNEVGITGIRSTADSYSANLVQEGGRLDTDIRFRINDGEWQSILKRFSVFFRPMEHEPTSSRSISVSDKQVSFIDYKEGMPFSMEQIFSLQDDRMEWDINLKNQLNYEVEIGDLAIMIPSSISFGYTQEDLYERNFTRSQFISGDGSFIIYRKKSGNPPFLVLMVKPGTHLEYFEAQGPGPFKAFVHSGFSGNSQKKGTWRQPHTYSNLNKPGTDGDELTYGFVLQLAESYQELRDILYKNRLFDFRAVPGMTIPQGMDAKFSLRSAAVIDSLVPEFPDETTLKLLKIDNSDHYVYEVSFNRLGENKISVYFDGHRKTQLEFFSTEPIETLLEKRSEFIVANQQHRDHDLWYDGLYSIWDMKNEELRGPDNTDGYDGWWGYMVASDDPVLGIAPYLASINVIRPDKNQIESLEYHIENFVWGGLQRKGSEDMYPYGIYGVPNWKVASDTLKRAKIENRRLDRMKIWRAYDYPMVFMLYYHMYQIAERYPDKVYYLDAEGYFERMWKTVEAFFTYPYEIYPWYDIYKWGFYNEMLIPEIINVLEEKEKVDQANWLRAEWEKKVRYFVYSDLYPYRSEYAFDRTAFESSYALAKYGLYNEISPVERSWYDKNESQWHSYERIKKEDIKDFLERQHMAGLSVRGWLEPKYYISGSDFTNNPDRHTLSYMARLGGWSILDYGLHFSDDPDDWLQLGYTSYLSSFALMNTGTAESNYGFWYPGLENDGAMGMAFMSAKHDRAWIQKNEDRGSWRYDGEQNLGMAGVTRSAQTILAHDSVFGWFGFGGSLVREKGGFEIHPKDGVRIRFWLVDKEHRLGIELERDGWSSEQPIKVNENLDRIQLILENRTSTTHANRLSMDIRGDAKWKLSFDGEEVQPFIRNNKQVYDLSISELEHELILEKL